MEGAYNSNLCFIAAAVDVAVPLTMADLLLMAMLLILLPFDRILALLELLVVDACGPYLALGPDF